MTNDKMRLTEQHLSEIEARYEAATDGPWVVGDFTGAKDSRFSILLAAKDAEIARLREALKQDRWKVGFNQGFACAVSALIRSHGCSTEAEELFRLIGDLSVADEHDMTVFRECGLLKKEALAGRVKKTSEKGEK